MSSNWRKSIIEEITRGLKPIALISDPDNLLGDQKIQTHLEQEGYLTYKYTDHILFRYTFETHYRAQLEKQNIRLVIITEVPETNLKQHIPYDLYIKSHVVNLSLKKIFLKLESQALKEISTTQIDRLYAAYQNYTGEEIGNRKTIEFILETIYGINPDSIITQTDYILQLVDSELPEYLYTFLNNELRKKRFAPKAYFDNDHQLINFLQKEWNNYISNRDIPSILSIPDIRSKIIQFLLEGKLQPVTVAGLETYPKWMQLGLLDNSGEIILQRIFATLERLESSLRSESITYREWKKIAYEWAQIIAYRFELESIPATITQKINNLKQKIDTSFTPWILNNHQSLYYIREKNPVTLSHITDHIHRNIHSKIAIIVIDGMSIDQWIKIKQCLENAAPGCLRFNETQVFAAIPTITSISRQTIASGSVPTLFKSESQAFNKEKSMWSSNWERKRKTSAFKKGLTLTNEKELTEISELFDSDALLLITTYLDDQIHGAINGKHELFDRIVYWIKTGIHNELFKLLDSEGYTIFVTSDHGNVESTGIGVLREGLLSDKESSRVRIYKNQGFARNAHDKFLDSILYPEKPDQSHYYLYAPNRKSFRKQGERKVTHGGLSIEEVLVPFVRIEVKNAS